MTTAFTRRCTEDRADGRLQFTFYCDICQSAYAAPAIKAPCARGLFRKQKLNRAYSAAFDEAQRDAREHFNRCICCKRWVCDADYSPDEGLCVECDDRNENEACQSQNPPGASIHRSVMR